MLISSPKAGIPAIVSLTGASLSPFGVGVLIEPFVVSKTISVVPSVRVGPVPPVADAS